MGLSYLNLWAGSAYTYRISHQEKDFTVVVESGYSTSKISLILKAAEIHLLRPLPGFT
jgi:hypothetical protein